MVANIKSELSTKENSFIPDIITFCESPHYLNLPGNPGNPIYLYPLQKIGLKIFYRGQPFNEKLKLTKEEIKLLKEENLEYLLDKYENKELFRELILVWGRRCIGENSLILNSEFDTQISVGKMWDNGLREVPVYSLDDKTYKFKPTTAEIIYNGIKPTFKLTLLNERSIEATDNHPFLTLSGWKELKDITEKDHIAVPRFLPMKHNGFSEKITQNEISWISVESIVEMGSQRTFDLSVDDDHCHNFVANNIIVHNSGKDMVSSLLASYEAMRLLEVPGGNPYTYYKIKEGNPIYIITAANSERQAKILFNEIKSVILNAPYFQDKIGDNGKAIDSSSIRLLTPSDKSINKTRRSKDVSEVEKGSVVILAGHSNSDSLRGNRSFLILLDEVALYKDTAGSASGDALYNSLLPSTADFRVHYKEKGEIKSRLDSKIVSISSPRGKDGLLWRMWQNSLDKEKGKHMLSMRAPTWKVNKHHTEKELREENANMPEQQFCMEFGAEFAGAEGEKFLSEELIDRAVHPDLGQLSTGQAGVFYYAHVDPAASSHNYALVVLHVENFIKTTPVEVREGIYKSKKDRRKRYVVDHLKVWTPTEKGGSGIDFQTIDEYMIALSKRFRFAMVSYDAFESKASMQRLRKHGIPVKLTRFQKRYKEKIYRNLENIFVAGDILIPSRGPHAKLLELELKNLKRKWSPQGGFRIEPNVEAEVTTDDLVDGLAGACGVAMDQLISGLPKGDLVNMPISRDNAPLWKIGHGAYSNLQFSQINRKFGIGDIY